MRPYPGINGGPPHYIPLFGLAPSGVYLAGWSPSRWCALTTPFHPYPSDLSFLLLAAPASSIGSSRIFIRFLTSVVAWHGQNQKIRRQVLTCLFAPGRTRFLHRLVTYSYTLPRLCRRLARPETKNPSSGVGLSFLFPVRPAFSDWLFRIIIHFLTAFVAQLVRYKTNVPVLRRFAFLWHYPRGRPHWELPSTLPCGARTFLRRHLSAWRPRSPDLLILPYNPLIF